MNNRIKQGLRVLLQPALRWHYKTFRAPKRYHHLYDVIRNIRARSILEVGVWNGRRAIKMIEEAKKHNTGIIYYGFDLFEEMDEAQYEKEVSKRPPTLNEVTQDLLETGAEVNLFAGNTLETMPKILPTLRPIDFVFIDGGHSLETIASDWLYVQQVMHRGTVVIFDDYWRNRSDAGAKTIVDMIDKDKFVVEILPEVDIFDNPDFGRLEISFARVKLV